MIPRSLETPRLALRATEPGDAVRAFEIQSNWNVTRNLRMAAFPPEREDLQAWFVSHAGEWDRGTAYRLAILSEGRMIGVIDIDEIRNGEGELGYWIEEASWGRRFAREAGEAMVRFAFETLGLTALRSGHAADNPASGKVLVKLGFRRIGDTTVPSRARGNDIRQWHYRLER